MFPVPALVGTPFACSTETVNDVSAIPTVAVVGNGAVKPSFVAVVPLRAMAPLVAGVIPV